MAAYGFTIPTITAALSRQNLELGGGKVQEGERNYVVRTMGEYSSIDEINDTVIATVNGYSIRLRDVGEASLGFAEVSSESFINGKKGVYINIIKQSGANTVNVANNVYEKMFNSYRSNYGYGYGDMEKELDSYEEEVKKDIEREEKEKAKKKK